MSTRSYICEELKNGKYNTIYCHWDGYLENNGYLLENFYRNRKKVKNLLALGDISSLAEKIDPDPNKPHNFDNHQENVVVAYGRDRGETDINARELTYEELTNKDSWIEFIYIFDKRGKWQVLEYPFDETKPLKTELRKVMKKQSDTQM